ncbi:DUF1326 domain-containing protein [soil metagenome]
MTPWEMKGREFINCTCEYGCNCQFNALPDKGHCHAVAGIIFDEGFYGDVRLDGLKVSGIYKWPGPIHEGNGQAIAFVDARADERQRAALLQIMSGQDTEPFATMFAVFASTLTKFYDPVFIDIDLTIDVDGRTGRLSLPGYVEMTGRPIRNPTTGAEQRAQIGLPDGFEYEVADIGSATSRTKGPLTVEIDDKYAQFAHLHLNNKGVVRSRKAA